MNRALAQQSFRPRYANRETAARLCLQAVLVGTAYYVGGKMDALFPPTSPSHFWVPNAVLLCTLLLTPVRLWWIYLLAVLPADLAITRGAPWAAALGYYFSNSMQSLIAAGLMRFTWPGRPRWDKTGFILRYVLLAAFLAPLLGALGGAATIHALRGSPYWTLWQGWFVAGVLTYLGLAPAFTVLGSQIARLPRLQVSRAGETTLMILGLVLVSIGTFELQHAGNQSIKALLYSPLPFLLWAAVRLGPGRAHLAICVVVAIAIHGSAHGGGPFAGSAAENVLQLQLFLIAMSLPIFWLAAVIEQARIHTRILSESERRFRALADNAPVMIWMQGTDKGCTFFNKRWLDFTGKTLEHELGHGWTRGVHPDDLERCLATHSKAFDARQECMNEFRIRRADGEFRWILANGAPRASDGREFCGYIGTCIDITDRRLAEEGRWRLAHAARLSMLGELSASIAHEINQPLSAILSNAQAAETLLQSAAPNLDEIRDIVHDIKEEDLRATSVIQQLRILLRRRQLTMQPFDMNAMVTGVVRLLLAETHRRDVSVHTHVDARLPLVVGDRIHLEQVLLNLMMNAMEAMADVARGGRNLSVRVSKRPSGELELSVEDSGRGIPPDRNEHLFEAFYTTKPEGLGLGLSIGRTVVEAHDGTIFAENIPGGGAIFRCILPATVWAKEDAAALPDSQEASVSA